MNARILSVILLIVSVSLAVFLFQTRQAAEVAQKESTASIVALSNTLHAATARLDEQQKVNLSLETNLTQRIRDLGALSNRWTRLQEDLSKIRSEAEVDRENAASEIQQRDKEIARLESERVQLGERMDELNVNLDQLATEIQETERKLLASEGDREFLQVELRRMMIEKAELERRMTDIVYLRDQVRKLREDMASSRRLDFLRFGFLSADRKADVVQTERMSMDPGTPSPGSSLNVELSSDGTLILPETNATPDSP
jgi:chromosome segregation ATPase